jgi:hypothetical protein
LYTRIISDVHFVCLCSNLFLTCSFLSYYLKAVCYLNNHGEDYKGGILQFQDGDPSCIVPVAGVSKSNFTLHPCGFKILLMKHTFVVSKIFWVILLRFMRDIFVQDVVIYTADTRNVHCVNEVCPVVCIIHCFFLFYSSLFVGYLDAYQLFHELYYTVNGEYDISLSTVIPNFCFFLAHFLG